jgi:hypothetical protein
LELRREKLLFISKDVITEIQKSPFLLFIRAKNFEPVGIMTKIEHKFDSGWGTMRPWCVGLTMEGTKFTEPLDRKNKRTGELEDLIQMKTSIMLITARNNGDPDDEDDSNFTYMIPPHHANRVKDSLDRIKERERIIHDLQKKLEETENQREYFQREADSSGSEIKMLKSRVALMSEKLADVEQQASHYRTELKKAHVGRLEQEGAIDQSLRGARDRGAFQAKDSSEVILDAAKKQTEAKHALTTLGIGEKSPEYVTKNDLGRLEERIMNLLENLGRNEEKTIQRPSSQERRGSSVIPPPED